MINKSLGGILIIKDGIKFDYCYRESAECLKGLCDQVIILDFGSTDGTKEDILSLEDDKTMIISADKALWDIKAHIGKERLSFYQNVALSFLDTDYYYLQQADEITPEWYFEKIRDAISLGHESYMISRINLWQDCNHFVNVPQNKQPCSQEVIRLAKTKYKSHGDGESIDAIASFDFIDKIKMYHYGFIRKREIMKSKVINMQEEVFRVPHDKKLDESNLFDSTLWFSKDELSKITEPHSKFIQEWIKTRP